MAQYTNALEKSLQDVYDYLKANHHNPSAGFYAGIDALEAVTEGKITLIDPTNPAVLLMETSSVGCSAAVNEAIELLRLQYPTLTENPEDLYNHMSDWDYVNRFASPCTEPIGILLGLEALLRDMIRDDDEKCKKAIIPRDTEVMMGSIPFTFMYPIVIRYYDTGTLSVSYDNEITSQLQSLETNNISYETNTMPDGTKFLYFQVPLLQVQISTVTNTLQAGRVFQLTFNYADSFFHCRAFIRNSSTANRWKEIKTTHSDLVYDRRDPTVILKVVDGAITATVPQLYTMDGRYTGEIQLMVYTTKGDIVENLASLESSIDLVAHDRERDLSDYTTQALVNVPRMAYSNSITSGGKAGLTTEQLRERVIFNSTGPQQLPVTNVQVEAVAANKGFELVKNTDVVTNRIFLANQKLPAPSNPRLITAANIGIETLVIERDDLVNNPYVLVNQTRWTLTPKCLFEQVNGVLKLLSQAEMNALTSVGQEEFIDRVNTRKFLFTPFHWVLDNDSSEFSLRAYYLNNPQAASINFIRQNQSLGLAVNTSSRTISRTDTGYRLTIRVLSGNHFKALPDQAIAVQARFVPSDNSMPVFVKGFQSGLSDTGEREFSFDFVSTFNINDQDQLDVQDVGVNTGLTANVYANLVTKIDIFICTNSLTSSYVPDESSQLYGGFQLPSGMVPITHESVVVTFGKSLKNLWSRARSLTTGYKYQTHENDIPLVYDQDVYDVDPVTGRLFTIVNGRPVFNVLHHQGEEVRDGYGNLLYKYRKGDPVLDPVTGNPVLLPEASRLKEIDLLMIDGRHYFVDDKAYLDYNQELINLLLSWITEDLASIQPRLLEQTKLYFHPRSQLGECVVERGDGITVTVSTEQSPVLDLYVPANVHSDGVIRSQLQTKAIEILDSQLSDKEINKTKIEKALSEAFGTAVESLKISQLGGSLDLHYAKVTTPNKQLSLKRVLQSQADGKLIIKEDVTFNFILLDD